MSTSAARSGSLSVGGIPTATGVLTLTDLGAHTVFQIATGDSTKRRLDPATAITVLVNSNAPDQAYAVDYCNGIVTFVAPPSGYASGVTIEGKYLPILEVAEVRAISDLKPPAPVFADVTRIGDTAGRLFEIAKKCSLSVEILSTPATDLDPGGGSFTVADLFAQGPCFLAVTVPGGVLRGWFAKSGPEEQLHALGDVLVSKISLEGVVRTCSRSDTGISTDQSLFVFTTT